MSKVELLNFMVCKFYLGEAALKLNWSYTHEESVDTKQKLKNRMYPKALKK